MRVITLEASLRMTALMIVDSLYQDSLLEVQDCKDSFSSLAVMIDDCIKTTWEKENTHRMLKACKTYRRKYKVLRRKLLNCINFFTEDDQHIIKNLLKDVATQLENFYKEITKKECEYQFLNEKRQLLDSYKVLSEKFREERELEDEKIVWEAYLRNDRIEKR